MRFFTAAVTLFALVASAVAQYPACTTSCLTNANIGNCTLNSLECLCANQVFIANTTACFVASCNATDLDTAEKVARESCAKIGITLSSSGPSPTASVKGGAVSPSPSASAKGGASTTTYSTFLVLSGAAALLATYI